MTNTQKYLMNVSDETIKDLYSRVKALAVKSEDEDLKSLLWKLSADIQWEAYEREPEKNLKFEKEYKLAHPGIID